MTEVPALFPCPVCELELEAGLGPGGLCWHDCETVLELRAGGTPKAGKPVDRMLDAIVRQVEQRADAIPAKDLASLLSSVAELSDGTQETGGFSDAFREWMEGGDAEADPLAS